ncbi:MAG: hypothetical protein ACPHL6_13085, partial [Rubripirellula sp.]
ILSPFSEPSEDRAAILATTHHQCAIPDPSTIAKEIDSIGSKPIPTVLAERGALILDDDGSLERGGKESTKFPGSVKLRAAKGRWQRSTESGVWRSTWNPKMGHSPVASYQGITAKDLIIEVTFRFGIITEPWHHQCFRIAVDDRPKITGHILSAWANPNNDFIEEGFLLQHIRKQPDKTVIEDLLLDHQSLNIQANQWHTAILEIVDDEALYRLDGHLAYAKAKQIGMPKNLVSLTMGTTWHEVKRVRIWKANANPSWPSRKHQILDSRKAFKRQVHNDKYAH